jgi:hypothetical protein
MTTAFLDRHRDLLVHLVVLAILAGGLGYSLYLGDNLRFYDPVRYHKVALNLATGHGYSLDGTTPTAFFTPAYPFLLALFIKLGASIVGLRYLNFILLAACVYVIRSILRSRQAESGAPVAAFLLAAYGVLFYTAGTLYPQTLFTLVLLLLIRLVLVEDFGWKHGVLLGMLSALLILVHPSGIFVPPLLVFWLILTRGWKMLARGIVGGLVAIVCILPWTCRNYLAYHKFIPVTTHGADTLYIGNNPETVISEWYNYVYHKAYQEAMQLPEAEKNRLFREKVIRFWTQQPLEASWLYLKKLAYYFNFRNKYWTRSEESRVKDIIMFVTYYPLLLALVLRLLACRRRPLSATEKLLVALYLGSALFYAIFIPRIRFRLPFDVVLITHIGLMVPMYREIAASRGGGGERQGHET